MQLHVSKMSFDMSVRRKLRKIYFHIADASVGQVDILNFINHDDCDALKSELELHLDSFVLSMIDELFLLWGSILVLLFSLITSL